MSFKVGKYQLGDLEFDFNLARLKFRESEWYIKFPTSYVVYKKHDKYYAEPSSELGLPGFGGTDAATVIQNAIDKSPWGGRVFVKAGTFEISKQILIDKPFTVEGENPQGTILKASASIESIFKFQRSGARFYFPIIRNIHLHGNNLATYGIYIDSTRQGLIENVFAEHFTSAFIYATSNQSAFTDQYLVEHCYAAFTPNFLIAEDGSAGIVSDWFIQDCYCGRLTEYGLRLKNCQKFTVINFFAGNNTENFNAVVRIESDSKVCAYHTLIKIGGENQTDTPTAKLIEVELLSGATQLSYGHRFEKLWMTPNTLLFVDLINNATGGYLRNIAIRDILNPNSSNVNIRIGSGVARVHITQDAEAYSDVNVEDNSGSGNTINGYGEEAAGAGNTPSAEWWDVGVIVHNTSDNTLWVKDKTGTWRQIA